MIADSITLSRGLCSLVLLFLPLSFRAFAALYLLCGISDVLDGFLARKLHTASTRGARLDSGMDLLFALAYAVKILPRLSLPRWIWVWTAVLAAAKIVRIVASSRKERCLSIRHSFANKLTGVLAFLLPLTVCLTETAYAAALVCASATGAIIEEWLPSPTQNRLP